MPTPGRLYHTVRDQLGSIRGVYLSRSRIVRHDDFDPDADIVLLLHGFFQTRNLWDTMEDRLRHDGFSVMSFNLGGLMWHLNTHPIDQLAKGIGEKLEALRERHGFRRVHIIGHSKGGLIARRYVQEFGGHEHVKSVITLGTPHHGTPQALIGVAITSVLPMRTSSWDLMPRSKFIRALNSDDFPAHIPLTSIYSRTDLVCPWWSSILKPSSVETSLRNVALSGLGHSQLAWDAGVYREVHHSLTAASAWWSAREGRAVEHPAR